jgi:hypothetical protein
MHWETENERGQPAFCSGLGFSIRQAYLFDIAVQESPLCEQWRWNCGGDDFLIYKDPDLAGCYTLCNMYTSRLAGPIYSQERSDSHPVLESRMAVY